MSQRKIGRIETFYAPPRWLFVRVESEDGAVGWGEASLEGWAEAVDGAFEALRDRFIGADPFNIEDIWQVGYRGGFYRGGTRKVSIFPILRWVTLPPRGPGCRCPRGGGRRRRPHRACR